MEAPAEQQPPERERFVIEELRPEDYPSVIELCTSVFCQQNELVKFLGVSQEAWHSTELYDTLGWEKSGLSLVMRDLKADNAIAAFLVVVRSTYLKPHPEPDFWGKVTTDSPGMWRLAEIDMVVKFRAFWHKRYRHAAWLTGKTCRVACGGTDAAYEGKGLGMRLRRRVVELARERDFDVIQVETVSPATQHIWSAKLGFEILARQKYSDYKAWDGSFPFQGLGGEYTVQQKVLRDRPLRDVGRIWAVMLGLPVAVRGRYTCWIDLYISAMRYIANGLGCLWVKSV